MKKLILFIIFSLLTSCSDSSFENINNEDVSFDEEYVEDVPTKKKVSIQELQIKACTAGCNYNYRILSIAKNLKTESISLNIEQLKSIEDSCIFFCKKKLLSNNQNNIIEDEPIEIKSFEAESKEKSKKENEEEITPFEDL